ncbi:MAG: peptidoglycan DD-metalloendopeptidase family protein [bacterium]|nr:peptidoglycan DD-metalloendopeptidase family protein [bacterium]
MRNSKTRISNYKTKTKQNLSNAFYRAICIVALFLIAVVFVPSQSKPAYAEMTEQEYNQQINNLTSQKNATNQSLNGKKVEARTLSGEVAKFDDQINTIQSQINATQAQMNSINSQIEDTTKKIAETEANLKIKRESLNEYLRVIYEDSNTSTMETIVASNSFSDFVDKTEYILTMQEKVKETVNEIKNLKKELENKKAELTKKGQEVKELKSQQVAQRQGLDNQRASKDQLLQSTKGQEAAYQNQLASIQKQMENARVAYEAAIASSSSSGESSYTGGGGSGYLIWPSAGSLTQGYGCTEFAQCGNPSGPYGGKIHNGLDISMGYPGTIKAAADGSVYDTGSAYNSQGWGNWIAIRHPNGLVTLYAHLSSIAVGPGQSVAKGQAIGTEGNTGFSFGSHLHFSVFTNFILYNTPSYHGPKYEGTTDPRGFL